jgi:hypothetical protein
VFSNYDSVHFFFEAGDCLAGEVTAVAEGFFFVGVDADGEAAASVERMLLRLLSCES